jgi:hypothetical protein
MNGTLGICVLCIRLLKTSCEIQGNGFLRNMGKRGVGTLVCGGGNALHIFTMTFNINLISIKNETTVRK